MTPSNSFAGMALGVGLLMAATSVPMVRSGRSYGPIPHAVGAEAMTRTVSDLQVVVDAQRTETRIFHDDARRLADIAADGGVLVENAPHRGTVHPRRVANPSPETNHVQPQAQ